MIPQSDELRLTWRTLRKYIRLQIEHARIVSTEKSAMLLSTGVLLAALAVFGACAMLFISIGLVFLLATVMPLFWCFMIMGGVYILLGVVLFLVRRRLIEDPIARFLSRLFLDNPLKEADEAETSHTEND